MDEFVIEAKVENLDEVLAFIDERLENPEYMTLYPDNWKI